MCVFSLLWEKAYFSKYPRRYDREGLRTDEKISKKSTYPMVAVEICVELSDGYVLCDDKRD